MLEKACRWHHKFIYVFVHQDDIAPVREIAQPTGRQSWLDR